MLSVMVVDDEEMIRLSFRKLINWGKYNLNLVKECSNGEDALEYIINNHIDILLTDVKMPIMDGITLLKELKTRNITPLATIMLSAFDEYKFVRDSFKLNADDYVLKSDYDEDYIIKIILNVVNKKITPTLETVQTFSYEITQILNYLDKNFHKNISLKNLSDLVSYSESYISHLFSEELGVPIMYYLNKLRVEKAKELLLNSNLKIYEISSKVGFQSIEHFSRSFKKHTGQSPKQLRSSTSI